MGLAHVVCLHVINRSTPSTFETITTFWAMELSWIILYSSSWIKTMAWVRSGALWCALKSLQTQYF